MEPVLLVITNGGRYLGVLSQSRIGNVVWPVTLRKL